MPKIDSRQDWTPLEAKENETTTYLKLSRLVDTCDKNEDYPILVKKFYINTAKNHSIHKCNNILIHFSPGIGVIDPRMRSVMSVRVSVDFY